MEDTHIWLTDTDGTGRHEISGMIDNRQGEPACSPDGRSVYFTVQERGNVRLYRLPVAGGAPEVIVNDAGTVGSWSLAGDKIAYAYSSPSDLAQLYLKAGGEAPQQLTTLNAGVLTGKQIAPVEPFTFISNDNKYEIEAYLTRPPGTTETSKHPLIVN